MLDGRVTKHCIIDNKKQKTIGKFYFKKPGKLFIKYANPEKTIILNDTILWLYSPVEKKVIKANYRTLSQTEKQSLGIETFLGFNPLQGIEESFNFELKDSIIIATPKHTPKIISKIIFELDTRKNLISNTKLFNLKDSLITETSYDSWENHEGVWFPTDIKSKIYINGKKLTERIGFQDLFINYDIADSVFNFIPPTDVEIIEQ